MFQESARRGYCPAHRHPLYVEYIETTYSLLLSVLHKADAAIDLSAAKVALRNRSMTPFLADESLIDSIYKEIITAPLRRLNVNFISTSKLDPGTGQWTRYKIECKGITSPISIRQIGY
jgi:hypothetical protein